MAAIDEFELPVDADPAALMAAAAQAALAWLGARALAVREVVVLVPFAALIPPLRAAFAAAAPGMAWQPRVETALTLAAGSPPPLAAAGACSGDVPCDRLAVAQALAREGAPAVIGSAEFEHRVGLVVDAAHRLRDAAAAIAPADREPFWRRLHGLLPAAGDGAGSDEAALLRHAARWAEAASPAATAALFELRPAAWIALRIGGADALADAVLAAADVPALRLDADAGAEADRPFARTAEPRRVRRFVCAGAEAEARAAAAEVIAALQDGRTPIALVAIDRARVRRVRALLERAGVALADETGWRLSTTRAGAAVMEMLRAAAPDAGADARLAWLERWPRARPRALRSLEAWWRGRRHVPDLSAARALDEDARTFLAPLAEPSGRRRSLLDWLGALGRLLAEDGSLERLATDAAGREVLTALTLDAGAAPAASNPAFAALARDTVLGFAGFMRWVEQALDAAPFVPPADGGAQVVVTPLLRAVGRPFAQVVLAGADHVNLGAIEAAPGLIGDALAARLGLPQAGSERRRQRLALRQLLRVPALTLLRRSHDADEPVADSPDVEWLLLERARAGRPPWTPQPAPEHVLTVERRPVLPPLPRPATALPPALSATQVEALRECPYRFYSRAVLMLDEADELDAGVDKRDYGNWLHLVLLRFHERRRDAPDLFDAERLAQAAREAADELGLPAGELLPFQATFQTFAPRYLEWLARHETAGWRFADGEVALTVAPPALAPTALRGRLDRLDRGRDGERLLIDYKTSQASTLKRQADDPLEDTQLAFYAALLGDESEPAAPVRALYLALDDDKAPLAYEHQGVRATAATLVEHLGAELARVRAGAALPALGEGPVCGYCEARGLCRRDHWAVAATPEPTPEPTP